VVKVEAILAFFVCMFGTLLMRTRANRSAAFDNLWPGFHQQNEFCASAATDVTLSLSFVFRVRASILRRVGKQIAAFQSCRRHKDEVNAKLERGWHTTTTTNATCPLREGRSFNSRFLVVSTDLLTLSSFQNLYLAQSEI
jgi:hypothetical protein